MPLRKVLELIISKQTEEEQFSALYKKDLSSTRILDKSASVLQ